MPKFVRRVRKPQPRRPNPRSVVIFGRRKVTPPSTGADPLTASEAQGSASMFIDQGFH
jgi:hypothetical protein